jgi:hypothetical protein
LSDGTSEDILRIKGPAAVLGVIRDSRSIPFTRGEN